MVSRLPFALEDLRNEISKLNPNGPDITIALDIETHRIVLAELVHSGHATTGGVTRFAGMNIVCKVDNGILRS